MKIITNFLAAALLVMLLTVAASGEEAGKVFATVDQDGVQRVEIVGGSYFFKPSEIVVKKGLPVELIVRKEAGIAPHDIVLHAPAAGIDFQVGLSAEPQLIRFTPLKSGSYPFYCSKKLLFFKSHRDHGMAGVLEVRD